MSSEPTPRGAAPAYDEAEKGTLDQVAVYPVEKKPITYPADEKKDVFNEGYNGKQLSFFETLTSAAVAYVVSDRNPSPQVMGACLN